MYIKIQFQLNIDTYYNNIIRAYSIRHLLSRWQNNQMCARLSIDHILLIHIFNVEGENMAWGFCDPTHLSSSLLTNFDTSPQQTASLLIRKAIHNDINWQIQFEIQYLKQLYSKIYEHDSRNLHIFTHSLYIKLMYRAIRRSKIRVCQ